MKLSLAYAVTIMLLGCTRVPASSPAPVAAASGPERLITLRVPDTVGAFTLMFRHNYENRALGVQLRYRGPADLVSDVFVYPGPDLASNCPVACAQSALKDEIDSFHRGIPDMIERGNLESARITLTEALEPDSTTHWRMAHHLALEVRRKDSVQRSEFYLYYLPGYRVKVRATFADSPVRLEAIHAFITSIVPALVRAPAPPT